MKLCRWMLLPCLLLLLVPTQAASSRQIAPVQPTATVVPTVTPTPGPSSCAVEGAGWSWHGSDAFDCMWYVGGSGKIVALVKKDGFQLRFYELSAEEWTQQYGAAAVDATAILSDRPDCVTAVDIHDHQIIFEDPHHSYLARYCSWGSVLYYEAWMPTADRFLLLEYIGGAPEEFNVSLGTFQEVRSGLSFDSNEFDDDPEPFEQSQATPQPCGKWSSKKSTPESATSC